MKKIFLVAILLMSIVQAADYYADLNIEVDSSGFVTIDGNTNHPSLLTIDSSKYTSKNQDYWVLNITKSDEFSEFIFSVELPEQSSINYIKSTGTIGIENLDEKLIVSGFGEDEELSIIIQYQINKEAEERSSYFMLIIDIAIFLLMIFILFLTKKHFKKSKPKTKKKEYDLKKLPERQKQIMQLLVEKNTPMTQAQIQKELRFPKASTSRNINSLALKGFIEKDKIGITNMIRLKVN